jgi:hypothetical protein
MGWVGSLQLFILAGGMLPMLAGCPKAGVHDDLLGDGLSCQWPKDAMAQAVSEKGAVCDLMQRYGTIHNFTGVALPARAVMGFPRSHPSLPWVGVREKGKKQTVAPIKSQRIQLGGRSRQDVRAPGGI